MALRFGVYFLSVIERINSSKDVKELNRDELELLCSELREFEININH